jgi:hypothetical protein
METELGPRLCVGRGLAPLDIDEMADVGEVAAEPPLAGPAFRATRGPRTLAAASPDPDLASELLPVIGFSSSNFVAVGVGLTGGTAGVAGDCDLVGVGGETTISLSSFASLSGSANAGRGGGL